MPQNVSLPLFILALALSALGGYLLGSINPAIIISRVAYGEDVRSMGSGNAGMTNMLRNFGKKGAAITMACDTGKGIVAVLLARLIMFLLAPDADELYGTYLAAICTILGHMFPLYFGFRGGKGVATSLGVILTLQPVTALVLLAIFLLVLFLGKMVSLGSVVGISFYPVITLLWSLFFTHKAPVYTTVCAAVITLLVIWMHRQNIGRIRAGTEPKIGQKKNGQSPQQASSGQASAPENTA